MPHAWGEHPIGGALVFCSSLGVVKMVSLGRAVFLVGDRPFLLVRPVDGRRSGIRGVRY